MNQLNRCLPTQEIIARIKPQSGFIGAVEVSQPAYHIPEIRQDQLRLRVWCRDTPGRPDRAGADSGRVQNADPVADEPELPNASDSAEGSLAQSEADGKATRALSIDSAERVAEVSEETTVEGVPHDFVGLVADRNVVVAESRLAGPGDLTVHVSILAKRRFLVRNYRSRGGNTLHVFGSIASGSLSATEPRFRTRLEFDPRLADARPPGFPVTDRYEVVEWDGRWTEELRGR